MTSGEDNAAPAPRTGDMVHRLNNLIGIVVANLDLLDSAINGDPEKQELVRTALDAALQSSDLIERLFAISPDQASQVDLTGAGVSPPRPDAAVVAAPGGERILVVDDNDQMRQAAVATLQSLDYATVEAVSGDAALARLESGESFDLIFTDIMMPGNLTGLELARVIKDRGFAAKIVFTTGFASPDSLNEELQQQGRVVLRKPYRKAALAQAIRQALDGPAS